MYPFAVLSSSLRIGGASPESRKPGTHTQPGCPTDVQPPLRHARRLPQRLDARAGAPQVALRHPGVVERHDEGRRGAVLLALQGGDGGAEAAQGLVVAPGGDEERGVVHGHGRGQRRPGDVLLQRHGLCGAPRPDAATRMQRSLLGREARPARSALQDHRPTAAPGIA